MELCNLRVVHIEKVIQQYGFPFVVRQAVQGFGKQLRSYFLACHIKGFFSFIMFKVSVVGVKLIFLLRSKVRKRNFL